MGLGSVLFIALIVFGIVLLLRQPPSGDSRGGDSARRILDERFARGEIDQDEYRRRRATLEH
jgi:putative membrane protein